MSNTNSHASLSSFGVASLRRTFPPPHNPTNKPSPSLPQHAPPYHTPQAYQPQHHPPSQYSHHLFTQTPSQLNSVASLQNAARPPPPSLPGPRPRVPAPRQMQQQQTPPQQHQQHQQPQQQQPPPPLSYLQQSLNQQPLGQQSLTQQPMTQQSIQQSMAAQSMAPQSMAPQAMAPQGLSSQPMTTQPMNPQQLSQPSLGQQPLTQSSYGQQLQQPMSQPPPAPAMTQSMSQQSMMQQSIPQPVQPVQQSDSGMLSQHSTPHPPHQPTLPPAQPQMAPAQQAQKVQQAPSVQQVQQVPQIQQVQQVQQAQPAQQQPPSRQSESAAEPAQGNHQDEDMGGTSHDESGEGDASSVEPRLMESSPFVPRQPMGPMMSAPPEGGSFPTLEAIHKHVLSYCTSVGYAVVIGRSKKTVPGLKKVLFVCDRAGKPPKRVSPEMRKRKTTSRKCDCQFGFFAIEQRTQWTVRYRPDPVHLRHNHGPSESPLLHPAARKLDSKMVAAVKELKENGVGVSQTLEILQQENPHVPLLPRDIYNARAAINRNPQKIASGLAENRPAIYSKPTPSAEERIRADLRRELQKARDDLEELRQKSTKEIEELRKKIEEKDKIIEKFEQFIDICNQRVTVRLTKDSSGGSSTATS